MATVPRRSEPVLPGPRLSMSPGLGSPQDAVREQIRTAAMDALAQYRSAADAVKLQPTLIRLQQICRQDIESVAAPGGVAIERNGGSALERMQVPLSQVVREHVIRVYRQMECNKTRAARVLEIDIKTLYNKLKRYGVQ